MGIVDRLRGRKRPRAPDVYEDRHLAAGTVPQRIGELTVNEVFKVQYDPAHAMRGGETTGYFKPHERWQANQKYAVGASVLAKQMGWGDLIADAHLATHTVPTKGRPASKVSGAVSRAAPGETLVRDVKDHPNQAQPGREINDIDLTRSTTQRQLNQLQWFDALIGNVDRHGGNILVDRETGRVTGIDNDQSFAGGFDPDKIYFAKGANHNYLGMPGQIDKATAKKLLKLNPKRLEKMLDPKKTGDQSFEDELPALNARLARIQDEIRRQKAAGGFVKKWDAAAYQGALNEPAIGADRNTGRPFPRNYVQRQHRDVALARNPQISDYWIRGDRQNTAPGSLPQAPAGAPRPPPARPPAPQRPARPVRPAPRPPHPAAPGRPRAARPMRPAPKPPTAGPQLLG